MPRPNSRSDAVALVRASRLVPEDRLRRFLAASADGTPDELLGRLVSDGLLTQYQATHLRAGRARGFRLGRYRLLDKLGSGGMGLVYLAEDDRRRRVAVKVLHADPTADPTARDRFRREAAAAARVDHPNVVRVFETAMDASPPYLAMEYVDGTTLQAAVSRFGPLAPREAAECGRQAALGLHAAGRLGLVHRDVKPANILIDRSGRVKVTDLGVVHVMGEESTRYSAERQLLGTLEYLSPEQAEDRPDLDARADIYGLGATLYFLLTGQPPFPDGNLQTKLARILRQDPMSLARLRPDVPLGLTAVIHRMMAKAPADRYPTAAAAAAALAPFAGPPDALPARLFATSRPTASDATGPRTQKVTVTTAGKSDAEYLAQAATDESPRLAVTLADFQMMPTQGVTLPVAVVPTRPRRRWPLVAAAAGLLAGLAALLR